MWHANQSCVPIRTELAMPLNFNSVSEFEVEFEFECKEVQLQLIEH